MACGSCRRDWDVVRDVVHGAVGLVKVAVGLERSPEMVSAARLESCRSCVHLLRFVKGIDAAADVGLGDRCELCGCFVRAKSLLSGERCPAGKWESVDG